MAVKLLAISGLLLSSWGAVWLVIPDLPDSRLKFAVFYITPPVRRIMLTSRGFLAFMTPGRSYEDNDTLKAGTTPKWAVSHNGVKSPEDWEEDDWESKVLFSVATLRSWRWRSVKLRSVRRKRWAEIDRDLIDPDEIRGEDPIEFVEEGTGNHHILSGGPNSEDWILNAEDHAISGFYTTYGAILIVIGFVIQIANNLIA